MDLLTLIILTLATWRISSLLVNEDGPWRVFLRLRQLVINATGVLTCIWCTSVWVGIGLAVAYWLMPDYIIWIMLPLAMSAGAIMWDRWIE